MNLLQRHLTNLWFFIFLKKESFLKKNCRQAPRLPIDTLETSCYALVHQPLYSAFRHDRLCCQAPATHSAVDGAVQQVVAALV